MPFLEISELSKTYLRGGEAQSALQGINLKVEAGEILAVVGPSGCGKSTLLNLLAGLDSASEGRICVEGNDITRYSRKQLAHYRQDKVGILFQFFNLFSSLSLLDNLLLPGMLRHSPPKEARVRAFSLLESVGLSEIANKRANEISGGEMQRVALCRALMSKPPLLLADEPTGNLDAKNREEILRLILNFSREENCTVLLVTHEAQAEKIADRVIPMKDGKITSC